MIRLLIALVFVVLLAGPTFTSAQTAAPDLPVIVTSGEGVVHAAPDRAYVTVSAESRASSPREAQRRNAEAMKPVQEKLRTFGIPAEAIRTTTIDLHMEYDFTNGRRVPRGYVAINSIEVRVDALDRLGELLDAVVATGATSVGDIRFDVRDRSKHEREAVRLAVQNARARADAAAIGAGRTIDRLLRIEEQGVVVPPMPMPVRAMVAREAAQAADTPISAGEMEFRARVTVTATFK